MNDLFLYFFLLMCHVFFYVSESGETVRRSQLQASSWSLAGVFSPVLFDFHNGNSSKINFTQKNQSRKQKHRHLLLMVQKCCTTSMKPCKQWRKNLTISTGEQRPYPAGKPPPPTGPMAPSQAEIPMARQMSNPLRLAEKVWRRPGEGIFPPRESVGWGGGRH